MAESVTSANADPAAVLDRGDPRFDLPGEWKERSWFAVACDRVDDIGAVTRLQRSGGKRFFAMTTVYVRHGTRWVYDFENGDLWPLSPTEPRPVEGPAFSALTGTSGAAVGPNATMAAFLAGVAATSVDHLTITSPIDDHTVRVDPVTGIFVALSTHASHEIAFQLVARDGNERELDRIDYQAATD